MLSIIQRLISQMKNQSILFLREDLAYKQPIVLFDGDCSLCSSSVLFLLRHNHSGNLRFASIKSGTGSEIIKLAGETTVQADTLLLLQDYKLYRYSTAALMISAHLGYPWHLLRGFIKVPPFIRDTLYRIIAKNRYKWFGKKSQCLTKENVYRNRFLY